MLLVRSWLARTLEQTAHPCLVWIRHHGQYRHQQLSNHAFRCDAAPKTMPADLGLKSDHMHAFQVADLVMVWACAADGPTHGHMEVAGAVYLTSCCVSAGGFSG